MDELVAEAPTLAHLPRGVDTALRASLSWPVVQRYARAMHTLFTFIDTHWAGPPLLPVEAPRLLLFLQHTFEEHGVMSRIDTTVRAVNWFHRMHGHPEVMSTTLDHARRGWALRLSHRVKHTSNISTVEITTIIKFALKQGTFVMFRLGVVVAVMATSGLRKTNVLDLAPYDLFFFVDRLVIFVASCKNSVLRHGEFRTIARTIGGGWCTARLLETYLARTRVLIDVSDVQEACPIFRASRGSAKGTVLLPPTWATRPIAASTMNATFRSVADELGLNHLTFHSLRVWMASTLTSAGGVVLTKAHGGWRSDAVNTYISQPSAELLVPSAVLTATLAAQIAGQQPPTAVSAPTALGPLAPALPETAQAVGPGEVLVSW